MGEGKDLAVIRFFNNMKIIRFLVLFTFISIFCFSQVIAQFKVTFSEKSADSDIKNSIPIIKNISSPTGFSWSCTDLSDNGLSELLYGVSYYNIRGKLLEEKTFEWKKSESDNINDFKDSKTHKIICNYWPKNTRKAIILIQRSVFIIPGGSKSYYAPGF